MRTLSLGSPMNPNDQKGTVEFILTSLREIENSSYEDVALIADNFTVTAGFTVTRSLNAGTATLAQLAAFVATFINDIKHRGAGRVE